MKISKAPLKVFCVALILAVSASPVPVLAYYEPYDPEVWKYYEDYQAYMDMRTEEEVEAYWNLPEAERNAQWDEYFKKQNEDAEKRAAEYEAYLERGDARYTDMDAYFEWFNGLDYGEQTDLIEKDWETQEQMRKDEEARAAAVAKAQAEAYAAMPITLKVNGQVVKTDVAPVIENGRTLAPTAAVVESLGYVVAWDSATQTIDIINYYTEAIVISMRIGQSTARVAIGTGVNSYFTDRQMDAPPKIINGRTMVPVAFIAENLGCTVEWNADTKTVSISAQG